MSKNLDQINPNWLHVNRKPVRLSSEYEERITQRSTAGQALLPTVSQEHSVDSTPLAETAVDRMLAKFRELFSLP